jgi:hypothetical protein
MRIMRFTILSLLTLLTLAIAIPAAATTCSICIQDVTVTEDGSQVNNGARCEPSAAGTIPDCQVHGLRGNGDCYSVALAAACGEIGGNPPDGCPPWGCTYMIKARKTPSRIRPIPSAI